MRRHPSLAITSLCLAAFLTAALLPTQAAAQGASKEDRTSVQELEGYTAGLSPDGLPSLVDLRPWLPAVGEQTMNDCAAWAFGYAGRTYLEAIDQGWKPDHPDRIFSPTFIYNQVNQGKDEGSRIDRVLDLLMDKGAATLSTAPYLPKDYLTPPPGKSQREARTFKIANFAVLDDGSWIRQALAEGYIVMCCVRTNPVFSSGRYASYTPELHAKGQAARRPDQPHGFHAMAIVGYNDERNAFLFMNSWGYDWGEKGHVWVDYDVLKQFNKDEITTELMDFAVVMIDRREPVARIDGDYQVLPLNEIQLAGFGNYSGYDEAAQAGAYRYTASLRGAPELMREIEEVTWTLPGPDGPRDVSSSTVANGFRMSGRSNAATIEMRAVARLKTGHEAEYVGTLVIPEAQKRSLEMERIDAFHEKTDTGNLWRWTMMPRLSDADWRDLVSIRYEFTEGVAVVDPAPYQHDGGLPPAWAERSLAMPTYRTSAPAGGRALLTFRDGTEHELLIPNEPFSDPVREFMEQEVVYRPVGLDGDRNWYFYEYRVRYPEAWADNILGIRIGTGQNSTWESHEAQAILDGPGPRMHVFHGYTHRPFDFGATAWFKQEHPQYGRTTPVMSYEIIPFGTPWTVPELADPDVLRTDHGFGIESRDRYLGEVDGKPVWEFEVFLDGTANIMTVDKVKWTTPDGEFEFGRYDEDESTTGPIEGYIFTREASEPFDVLLTGTLYDEQTFELKRTIQPFAPRNSAIAIDLTDITPQELSMAAPDRVLARVDLAGIDAGFAGLREVVGYSKRAWGGVLPTQLAVVPFNLSPEQTLGRIELPKDEDAVFLLHFDDGSAICLQARPHALAPQPALPALQLLARERFRAWEDGAPAWDLALEIRGLADQLEQIERIEWSGQAKQNGSVQIEETDDPLQAIGTSNAPCTVSATVHFLAELGREPMSLQAEVLAMSQRIDGEARVRVEEGWVWDPIERYGPNVDPWSIQWPSVPYRFQIDASPSVLDQIAEVRWEVRDPWAEEYAASEGEDPPSPELHIRGEEYRDAGFAWSTKISPDEAAMKLKPTLVFLDGSERELAVMDMEVGMKVDSRLAGTFYTQLRDWGVVDGKRASLLIASVPNGQLTESVLRAEFEFDEAREGMHGLPPVALERPISRRTFLSFGPGKLESYVLTQREEGGNGFELEDRKLRKGGNFGHADAIETPTLAMHTVKEEGGSFYYLSLRAPESLLAQTDRIAWSVWQDGERSVHIVRDRIGERSDAFELRLTGPRPSRIEAKLFSETGPITGANYRRDNP